MRSHRRTRTTVAAVLSAAGLVGGCATQSDLQGLRQDVREARTQAADAQATVVGLRQDVQGIKGELEQMRFQSGSATRTEEIVAHLEALDARVATLEQMLRGGGPVVRPGDEAQMPAGPGIGGPDLIARALETDASVSGGAGEFQDGLGLLRAGQHREAIQKLREFLRRSPKSDLADNAQYWIGEAYYAMRDYNRAILEFNEVLLRYPKGDKIPAALLRQAFAFADLGDKVDARLVLQKLVSEHGSSPEAELGRQKLTELSS